MVSKIYNTRSKKQEQANLIYEVVRPQRKKLSRYKLKKQAGIIEGIINDPQIMDM